MEEKWLTLDGFGNAYSVSSFGRIMRTSPRNIWWRIPGSRRAKPFKPSLIGQYRNRSGYMQARIGPTGEQRCVSVHRLIALTFIANPNGFGDVNHIDGNKTNNNVNNLEWVTRSANVLHAINNGLLEVPYGENHGNAKITDEIVVNIRNDARIQRVIAEDYGIDQTLVSMIKLRKIWKHVPERP